MSHTSFQLAETWTEHRMEDAVRFLKSMAHPSRLRTLIYLKDREASVNELEVAVGISQSNMSQHLGQMKRAGLLKSRRSGAQVFYSVAGEHVLNMVLLLINAPETPVHTDPLDDLEPEMLNSAYSIRFKG
jgi:DNA-binding transcriptional ArsR family regulator